MSELDLLIDLHRDAQRQGPGSDAATRLAVQLSGLGAAQGLSVADIGCGSGAPTMVLARELDAKITALDFLPEFLEVLSANAQAEGLSERIDTVAGSMDALPFAEGSLDAIWSEGAIYNIGFEAGVAAWRKFLKPGGVLAVSELTWLTQDRPEDLEQHWMAEYPQVDTAAAKITVLERHGFSLRGYFPLSKECWLDNYYWPMQARFPQFLKRHGASEEAQAIVASEEHEIALYETNADFVSYGYYIAQKIEG